MIIQCDHCSAKFRMDDSKLANGPVKVRCAKCKEVFIVQKEEPAAESALSPQPESLSSEGLNAEMAGFSFDTPDNKEDPFSEGPTDFSFDVDSQSVNKAAATEQADTANKFDWQASAPATDAAGTDSAFDLSAFDASLSSSNAAVDTTTAADDNDFNFGDLDHGSESRSSVETTVGADGLEADDFSMDFGDISFSGQSSVAPSDSDSFAGSPAGPSAPDDFVLSFNSDSVPQPPVSSPAAEETETVNFGEFSFGEIDESPVTQSSKPVAGLLEQASEGFAHPEPTQDYSEEVLPPLSLTSRKKSGSLFPLLVILGAIVLIIVTAGSGVYFFSGPKAFTKVGLGFLVEWYGDKGRDDGNIALKAVTASYIVNSTAGELFVVRGEAVNNFKKPRASIQIKVSLLGAGGVTLITKSAFCGNSLSNEQLTSLPLAKIEEIMNNQFGDSLANLGLNPGGTIPFVIVVSSVPKDSTDYSVQVGGSTVATQ